MATAGEQVDRAGAASPPTISDISGHVTTTVAAVLLVWQSAVMMSPPAAAWLGARVVTPSGVTITRGQEGSMVVELGMDGRLALLPPAAGSSVRGCATLHREGAGLERPASGDDVDCGSLLGRMEGIVKQQQHTQSDPSVMYIVPCSTHNAQQAYSCKLLCQPWMCHAQAA
jgi:hypothetical protein